MTTISDLTETAVWRDRRAVALLMAATLTVMANATISPALPGLQKLFQDNPNAAWLTPLLVTAPSLSIALLAPLAGFAMDWIGRRVLLLAGILLFVVSGSAGLYLPDLPTILISRIVLGIAVALVMTAQTALIGDYFTGEARSALTGLQVSARNLGGLVLILLSGMVAAVSPRWAFGVYGLALLVLPFAWMAIVEPPRPALSVRQASDASPSAERQAWRLPFLGLVAVQSLTNMFFFVMPTQLPFFLDARGDSSATMTSLALGLLMLSGGSVALLYARVQRAIGYGGVFAFGYAAMAIGFLLLVTTTPLLIMVGAAWIGAGYAAVSPTFVALTLALAPPKRRGLAGGLLTASVFIGQFISPLLSTPLIASAGYEGLFQSAALILAAMAAIALGGAVRRGRQARPFR